VPPLPGFSTLLEPMPGTGCDPRRPTSSDLRSTEVLMAKLPLRMLGLALLTVTITVASCQALFHDVQLPFDDPPVQGLER
jgi:hypothetical protein